MIIIALAGRKGSGKTEVANALEKYFSANFDVRRLSFATPLKSMLQTLGVPDESLYGNEEEKNKPIPHLGGVTGRYLMVTLGTEWGRTLVHKDLWVLALAQDLEAVTPKGGAYKGYNPVVIIDDLRMSNELEFLRSKGATIIGIHRGELPGSMLDQHISEQLPYRFAELGIPVLKNDSTLADLHQKVIALAVPNP